MAVATFPRIALCRLSVIWFHYRLPQVPNDQERRFRKSAPDQRWCEVLCAPRWAPDGYGLTTGTDRPSCPPPLVGTAPTSSSGHNVELSPISSSPASCRSSPPPHRCKPPLPRSGNVWRIPVAHTLHRFFRRDITARQRMIPAIRLITPFPNSVLRARLVAPGLAFSPAPVAEHNSACRDRCADMPAGSSAALCRLAVFLVPAIKDFHASAPLATLAAHAISPRRKLPPFMSTYFSAR